MKVNLSCCDPCLAHTAHCSKILVPTLPTICYYTDNSLKSLCTLCFLQVESHFLRNKKQPQQLRLMLCQKARPVQLQLDLRGKSREGPEAI